MNFQLIPFLYTGYIVHTLPEGFECDYRKFSVYVGFGAIQLFGILRAIGFDNFIIPEGKLGGHP